MTTETLSTSERTWGYVTCRVLQAHTPQAGWTPDAVASLWKVVA